MIRASRRALSVCAAALFVLVWPAHMLSAHHDHGGNCQVCATVCSPELNSDCGGLIPPPEGTAAAPCAAKAARAAVRGFSAFLGRAPPAP
ncbi:MAG TPA: hypothetical protein PKK31_08175 [Elusimicrobiales bacterium]|nr:hypothetical protein [Elusimicrobiales bacterium]